MNEDVIRQIIEMNDPEGKIPASVVDELVAAVASLEKEEVERPAVYEDLAEKVMYEPDWRKRAAMVARMISRGLE